jgi:hypothetical protein
MKPVPRTAAVSVGVRISNFESARTLAQVRPRVCEMRMSVAPSTLAASSICTVVNGSISSVDPSKNVTIAWLSAAV